MSSKDLHKKFFNSRLVAGWVHTLLASDDGQFYGFGVSKDGELGHGVGFTEFQASQLNFNIPPIAKPDQVQVAVGSRHSLILADGNVYSSGAQDDGRLGHHLVHGQIKFPNVDKVAFIACSADSSMAISEDGKSIYIWGRGYTTIGSPEPQALRLIDPVSRSLYTSKIISAACGTEHALVLCQDGTVWSWGSGRNGRLGHGHENDIKVPTVIKSLIVSEDQKIVQIACGDSHNLALSAEGRVFAWGSGAYGRLGLGIETDVHAPTMIEQEFRDIRILAVTCNSFHSAALALPDSEDFSLYTWGGGKYGKLGHSDTLNRLRPAPVQFFKKPLRAIRVVCGQHHTVAITLDNRIYAWGCGMAMRCGFLHDSAVVAAPVRIDFFDDKRICSLAADMKTLEVKQPDYKCRYLATGERHSVAHATESNRHVILAWGSNACGQMGVGKMAQSARPIPVALPAPATTVIAQVVCGANFSMCLSDSGTIYTWGDNSKGQLGLGDTSNRAKPAVVQALQGTMVHTIVAGWAHAAAIASGGDAAQRDDVYVWGDHQYGQLGVGSEADAGVYPCFPALATFPKSLRVASTIPADKQTTQRERVSLALGTSHSMILVERYEVRGKKVLSSRVYTCGMGSYGQLGSHANTQATYPTPRLVSDWHLSAEDDKYWRENARNRRDDVLADGTELKLPKVHLIAASETASIAVSNPSDIEVVYAWGLLPGLHDGPQSTPAHIQKLANAEELKQELGSDLPINDFRIVKIVTARSHHLLLCKFNEKANHGRAPVVFGWGETKYGKLGVGNVARHMAQKLLDSHMKQQGSDKAADEDKEKKAETGEFSTVLGPELLKNLRSMRIAAMSSLADHCALVTDEGEAYVWGYGEGGRLGLGDGRSSNNKSESEPVVVPLFHKAERQMLRVTKRRLKQQQENKQQYSDVAGTEAADLARKAKLLRYEFTKSFSVHKLQHVKALLEQVELVHTAILQRVAESQGDVNSLTSRQRIREANNERRLMKLRQVKAAEARQREAAKEQERAAIEMANAATAAANEEQPRRKQKPKDKEDSGSCVCCCGTDEADWDLDVDVESTGEEADHDMDGYLEEQAMQQKVSFERDLLNASETLVTRLYSQPCAMFRAYQYYASSVQAVLQSADVVTKTKRKHAAALRTDFEDKTKEEDQFKSAQVVAKANNLRERFCSLVFSVYDLHRDEDIRVFHVFLRLLLEQCTRGKTKQNILTEESLEWAMFKDVFLHGRIRRQLGDILAKALAELPPFAPSNDRSTTCATPVDWLENYLEDKTTDSVVTAFRLIRQKTEQYLSLLESEQYLASLLATLQWPLVVLCSVLRRSKIDPQQVLGRVALKLIAEVLLADQTYQFERKRRQLQRKGFTLEELKGVDAVQQAAEAEAGGDLGVKRWTAKTAVNAAISSGASQLGPSETLVLLQLKDVGSELGRDDVTDLILYVTGRYKIPDYVMKKISYGGAGGPKQHEHTLSVFSHPLVDAITATVGDAEVHESRGESSTHQQTQLDLLTHFLRMPFFFPRRLAQVPRNTLHLLCTSDFCSAQDRKHILKELGLHSLHAEERDQDATLVNLRIDPTRCDFEARRKSTDESCPVCKCMHPRMNINGQGYSSRMAALLQDPAGSAAAAARKDKDVSLSFTKAECDLMFDILCEPTFVTIIEELNGESCWQALMAELKVWREHRIDLFSEQEGGHDYEVASYAFKRLLKVSKGTKLELGERHDLVTFLADSTCVEPALLREKLVERDAKKREHTDEEQRKVAALDSLKRSMEAELRQEPQLIAKMSQDFVSITDRTEVDLAHLDRLFHLNPKNTDQRTLRKFADKLRRWGETHVVRERGKMLRFSYQDLVTQRVLYRVKPLRRYLPCLPWCCLQLWGCCHCTSADEQRLVRFLSGIDFVMLTSADPDVVHLKVTYRNKARSTHVIILKSVLVSLKALTTDDCTAHRILYDPLGDDVPIVRPVVFQFSKARLKRLLQRLPRNIKDEGIIDDEKIVDVI